MLRDAASGEGTGHALGLAQDMPARSVRQRNQGDGEPSGGTLLRGLTAIAALISSWLTRWSVLYIGRHKFKVTVPVNQSLVKFWGLMADHAKRDRKHVELAALNDRTSGCSLEEPTREKTGWLVVVVDLRAVHYCSSIDPLQKSTGPNAFRLIIHVYGVIFDFCRDVWELIPPAEPEALALVVDVDHSVLMDPDGTVSALESSSKNARGLIVMMNLRDSHRDLLVTDESP